MNERLNPLTLPLQGSRLIEASAGTGKTWTIAALYLRLVLGHGGQGQGPVRALLPGEILVMTFTKAATRELSDRIRQRLVQAAACFRGEQAPPPGDHFLADLLADHPLGSVRSQAAWRLAMAAEAMDDAAVHTIDAWCQRMLREHAFDSGCLFDEALQANEAAMLAEAARDYWRQQVYPLSADALAVAL
jgi:exodeoxyribonuclease V beta subunit